MSQGVANTRIYELIEPTYSLGYRTVKYLVKFGSSGGTATFKSNSGDTIISVDYTNGTFTQPL